MLSFFSPSFGYVNAMLIKKKKKKAFHSHVPKSSLCLAPGAKC